jgi:hypothetical protein
MRPNVSSRLSTDTALISDLITGIKKGEIKIPQFQRRFVWKDDQALRLLDSLASNYPVGSLLLWKTKEKLHAERNIGDFKLPQTDDLTPTDYVLDGQQRLTVIYSCFGAPVNESGFAAAYDLDEEFFIQLTQSAKPHQFPLRWLFQTTDLLNYRTGIQTLPRAEAYQERLDLLINALTNYRFPVVTLKDLTVEEVCPIFERINSSGTSLSTFDLMVAATWSREFDLNDEVDIITEALEPKGFGDIDRTTVLKCLAAVQLGSVKERSLVSLRDLSQPEMQALVERTKDALLRTIDLLSTEFRIHSWDFLSYEAFVVILCAIYSRVGHLSNDSIVRVRQWFWRASFGERYKVGGESFVSNDISTVAGFVLDGAGTPEQFGSMPSASEWMTLTFRSNVSRSRAFILALAARAPRNLTNGLCIDVEEALSSYNKKEYHHIHPRAYLRRSGSDKSDNLLANICMLASSENKKISDRAPQEYLAQCSLELASEADAVFSSNLLPMPSQLDYSVASYEEFLEARIAVIQDFIDGLATGRVR